MCLMWAVFDFSSFRNAPWLWRVRLGRHLHAPLQNHKKGQVGVLVNTPQSCSLQWQVSLSTGLWQRTAFPFSPVRVFGDPFKVNILACILTIATLFEGIVDFHSLFSLWQIWKDNQYFTGFRFAGTLVAAMLRRTQENTHTSPAPHQIQEVGISGIAHHHSTSSHWAW